MEQLPFFIKDLSLILATACITTLLFRYLKQPVMLGYVIAGLITSPNFSLFPTISSIEGIQTWADIGVVFLLFSLGLEFSIKRMLQTGGSAFITGVFEISAMFALGYFTGKLLHWNAIDCIFLGGILSISSTTIIYKCFEELGLKTKHFTHLVISVLVIEDLMAVLLMVLLPALAVNNKLEGKELLYSLARLVFFLALWFLMGIYLLPTFFKRIRKLLNNETLLIIVLALCFGMVMFAEGLGFSSALGAFIMGSILAETVYVERIERLIVPLKDLFGAIFFVSVGMLIDLSSMMSSMGIILLLSAVLVVGKFINVTFGALLAGQPLKQSIQAASSMTQIGEFSFIIAGLGLSLGVTGNNLYPVAVGISILTTFITPYMIRFAEPCYYFIEKKLPKKLTATLNRYSEGTQSISSESDWKKVWQLYIRNIFFNSVILISILILNVSYLYPWLLAVFDEQLIAQVVAAVTSLLIMSPFLWALAGKKLQNTPYIALWLNKKYNRGPLVLLEIIRIVLAILFVAILLQELFSITIAIIGSVVVIPFAIFVFRNRLQRFYLKAEKRFYFNFHSKENEQQKQYLSPWDVHITNLKVSPYASYTGISLKDLAWREKYGVNIAFIRRGEKNIYAPNRNEKLFPYDYIGIIGTDEQIQKLKNEINNINEETFTPERDEIVLQKVIVNEHTQLKGKTIRDSHIREITDGLVVGIERNNERILNPSSDTVFEWNDIVWIVGNKEKIKNLYHHSSHAMN